MLLADIAGFIPAHYSRKGVRKHGTDYELCKAGTSNCSRSTVLYRNGNQKIRSHTGQIYSGNPWICGIYVIATCAISGEQEIAMAIFTAITQGILVAGLSNYVNQIVKQASKED